MGTTKIEQRNRRREKKLSVIRECRLGANLTEAAGNADTTPLQIYRWMESDPEFCKTLDNIKLYWMLDENEPDEAALMQRLNRDIQDSISQIQHTDRKNRRWTIDDITG